MTWLGVKRSTPRGSTVKVQEGGGERVVFFHCSVRIWHARYIRTTKLTTPYGFCLIEYNSCFIILYEISLLTTASTMRPLYLLYIALLRPLQGETAPKGPNFCPSCVIPSNPYFSVVRNQLAGPNPANQNSTFWQRKKGFLVCWLGPANWLVAHA